MNNKINNNNSNEILNAVVIWFGYIWELSVKGYLLTFSSIANITKAIETVALKVVKIFIIQLGMLVGMYGTKVQITFFVLLIFQAMFIHSLILTTIYAILIMQKQEAEKKICEAIDELEKEIELNKK